MSKTIIIAEAGVNHNGSMKLAKQLIDVAAEAGVDYVKFQSFKASKLVSASAQKAVYQVTNTGEAGGQFEMLKKLELDKKKHLTLQAHCKERGVKFLSSPFDLDSIDLLEELDVDLFKIPSGEITNLLYLEKIASKGKPIVLSTGMCTLGDIEKALDVLIQKGAKREQVTLLHCNSEYPTPIYDVHLKAMATMAAAFNVKVGYSDHTLGIEVPIAAVALGAVCIEKHFTLDRNLSGPDHRASLEPSELKQMVLAIRNIERALGSSIKRPSSSEQKNRPLARKSIHLKTDLPLGHLLTLEDLEMKRPGVGISPMNLNIVLGKKLKTKMRAEVMISLSDLI